MHSRATYRRPSRKEEHEDTGVSHAALWAFKLEHVEALVARKKDEHEEWVVRRAALYAMRALGAALASSRES